MTDLEIEKYMQGLGLSWVTIAEAMSDENCNKTRKILNENPKISKIDLLKTIGIEEFKR